MVEILLMSTSTNGQTNVTITLTSLDQNEALGIVRSALAKQHRLGTITCWSAEILRTTEMSPRPSGEERE